MDELSQFLANWPPDAPQSATELQFTDPSALAAILAPEDLPVVLALRKQILRASQSWGRSAPLASPAAVEHALATNDLRLVSRRWLTLSLDRHRRRSFKEFSVDSSRTVERLTRYAPEAGQLPELPADGVYLVLYGGGPDVLEIPDVRDRLRALASEVVVADVLFRQLEKGPKSTLFSLREGFGVHARTRVEFPDPELVEELPLWGPRRPSGSHANASGKEDA